MFIRGSAFEIRPVAPDELEVVLEVYRLSEDFLALGPQPLASVEMVLNDMDISQAVGGVFCGIYTLAGGMLGIVDFVPHHFGGNPHHAFISLLMIARPFRSSGLGVEVVQRVEQEIMKDPQVHSILSAVQTNNPAAIRFWQRQGYQIIGGPDPQPDQTIVYHLKKDVRHESDLNGSDG